MIEQSNGLHFMYDHTGVMGFTYQGQTYFYQKDLQGNIFAIVNASGVAVAFYHYDAWGNHKVYDGDSLIEMTSPTFIGNLNPFRYRGYYYDTETNLYYLQSRYYDPEVGRFISADTINYAEPSKFGGLNLYAYCNNNPVMFVDPEGTSWRDFTKWVSEHALIVEIVAIVAAVAITVASWGSATPVAAMVIGGIVGGEIGALNAVAHKEDVLIGTLTGAFVGFVGGAHWALAALAAFGTTFTRARVNKVQITSEVVDNAFLNAASASLLSLVSSHAYNYFLDPTPIVRKALYNMTYPIENVIGVAGFTSLFFSNVNGAGDLLIEHIWGK